MLDHFTDNRGRPRDPPDVGAVRLRDPRRHVHRPIPSQRATQAVRQGSPAVWVACGNPGTFTTAGELGIGAIAFNFEPIFGLRGRIDAYKQGAANCTEPPGQYKNDNVMINNSVICSETREEARKIALRKGRGYLVTTVNMYHDTMPKSRDAIVWPNSPITLHDIVQDPSVDADELLDGIIKARIAATRRASTASRQPRSSRRSTTLCAPMWSGRRSFRRAR